jgi:hypothetical protein
VSLQVKCEANLFLVDIPAVLFIGAYSISTTKASNQYQAAFNFYYYSLNF